MFIPLLLFNNITPLEEKIYKGLNDFFYDLIYSISSTFGELTGYITSSLDHKFFIIIMGKKLIFFWKGTTLLYSNI